MTQSELIKNLHQYFPLGIAVSRRAWRLIDMSVTLFTEEQVSETMAVRQLVGRYNAITAKSPAKVESIYAGQLVTAATIVDVLRFVILTYCETQNQGAISTGCDFVRTTGSPETVERPPVKFVNLFPPTGVLSGDQSEHEFLLDDSLATTPRDAATCEMILLGLAITNPAFRPMRGLFDDSDLKKQSPYLKLVQGLEEFFDRQPPVAELGMTLFDCLRAPMRASPDSLDGQLHFIREHWSAFLPSELLERVLKASDLLAEEQRLRGLGPGPTEALDFMRSAYASELEDPEPERFSRDADWMSNVVIIAKSVYVWLDQLSKKYERHIKHLDDIPDEELDLLAHWGFSGLWLIGLWERSSASQQIKQIMGNPEAAASAYSLYDYTIASDLGGEDAYQKLAARAWQRGIRLASDMVPNHMGVFSRWVIEHPDWFLQLSYPPYPAYNYTGVDLSPDKRVTIQLDDGYWEHRDAAVVFRRYDTHTGDVRYIYHGNDGTSMPWNDTAQLNFMLAEVREAVLQTILHVARKFPIIRFDAAMTLAKKHYQRLWFPKPGDGGAVPSRSEHGLTKAEFDAAFPVEFWRDVVDRVAAEVPDTLLLAEAFWLMEGYFVRTLGMHRVYNSAFMNMLKTEDNANYRTTIKNVLEFSPEILKRFVNFMNNPDEATAVEQFGKDDKYFGVAVLMVTMPGLPMFGHGQIEGLTEKYGMEYRRAYWDEKPDEEMVARHQREIFPLMRRRSLFSGAENFALYDFNTPEGWVDENVFAYSNRAGDERAIILFNNAYNTTSGWVRASTTINTGSGDKPNHVSRNLGEALALNTNDGVFYRFRDHQSGLQYVRSGRQLTEEGLFAVLHGYQYHAFVDFQQVDDSDGSWSQLTHRLGGGGVPNLEYARCEMQLEPILTPFRNLIKSDLLRGMVAGEDKALVQFKQALKEMLHAVRDYLRLDVDLDSTMKDALATIKALLKDTEHPSPSKAGKTGAEIVGRLAKEMASLTPVLLARVAIDAIAEVCAPDDTTPHHERCLARFDDWLFGRTLYVQFGELADLGIDPHADTYLVRILLQKEIELTLAPTEIAKMLREILESGHVRDYLRVNQHNDTLWLSKERLERLVSSLLAIDLVRLQSRKTTEIDDSTTARRIGAAWRSAGTILIAAEKASYRVEKMLRLLSQ